MKKLLFVLTLGISLVLISSTGMGKVEDISIDELPEPTEPTTEKSV